MKVISGHPRAPLTLAELGRCSAHSRWERYAADDWFPHGGMAGRSRLRAARCVACCTHRQIRFDGEILVMTVAHVAHCLQGRRWPAIFLNEVPRGAAF